MAETAAGLPPDYDLFLIPLCLRRDSVSEVILRNRFAALSFLPVAIPLLQGAFTLIRRDPRLYCVALFHYVLWFVAQCAQEFIAQDRPYLACVSPLIMTRYGMPSRDLVYTSSVFACVALHWALLPAWGCARRRRDPAAGWTDLVLIGLLSLVHPIAYYRALLASGVQVAASVALGVGTSVLFMLCMRAQIDPLMRYLGRAYVHASWARQIVGRGVAVRETLARRMYRRLRAPASMSPEHSDAGAEDAVDDGVVRTRHRPRLRLLPRRRAWWHRVHAPDRGRDP